MKRKWMIPLLTGIFAASLIIGITTAYFSDSAAVSPDITAGTVVIDLSENFNLNGIDVKLDVERIAQ